MHPPETLRSYDAGGPSPSDARGPASSAPTSAPTFGPTFGPTPGTSGPASSSAGREQAAPSRVVLWVAGPDGVPAELAAVLAEAGFDVAGLRPGEALALPAEAGGSAIACVVVDQRAEGGAALVQGLRDRAAPKEFPCLLIMDDGAERRAEAWASSADVCLLPDVEPAAFLLQVAALVRMFERLAQPAERDDVPAEVELDDADFIEVSSEEASEAALEEASEAASEEALEAAPEAAEAPSSEALSIDVVFDDEDGAPERDASADADGGTTGIRTRVSLHDAGLVASAEIERLRRGSLSEVDAGFLALAVDDAPPASSPELDAAPPSVGPPLGEAGAPCATLSGELDTIALTVLLPALEMERRSGVVVVRSGLLRAGLELDEGRAKAAWVMREPIAPLAALQAMIACRRGRFEFWARPAAEIPSGEPLGSLLAEALRIHDEQRAQKRGPSGDAFAA